MYFVYFYFCSFLFPALILEVNQQSPITPIELILIVWLSSVCDFERGSEVAERSRGTCFIDISEFMHHRLGDMRGMCEGELYDWKVHIHCTIRPVQTQFFWLLECGAVGTLHYRTVAAVHASCELYATSTRTNCTVFVHLGCRASERWQHGPEPDRFCKSHGQFA